MTVKIALVGKPGMGKTTIKKVIFEGVDPNELILFPLEATIGSKFSVHDFMDLKISLVDTPGQSMPILLEDEEKHISIFENTSVIIYLFDYNIWIAHPNEIINDIKKIFDINEHNKYGAKIYLYLHKIDLIDQNIIDKFTLLKTQILNKLELSEELQIYFTSLHPSLIYTIFNALSDTLSDFSPEMSNLKVILNKIINGLSKTICFIINQNNNVIIQAMTNDFDINSVYHLYNKIIQLSQSTEELRSNKSKFNLVESSSKLFFVMVSNIEDFHPNLKNVIIFSETLEKKDLINLISKLKQEFGEFFNSISKK